ncbi:acidic leucine-rich nuclear phosphoprotein 32-related protein 2-like [Paramacrobiotus metropolitanus]|uniref:acidic leucine-rich nuclear phosphoprotein 32-related protein 2-like n=1 Tax=Paramacrobiotus metropolitanus TaxID=2943436 RepID=UPI002445FEC7|nr:acidic leucine-rich nuclear phosphoprotein 32-related protein 2-like [Paramacrobiotus metropolitanus]
MLNDNLLDDVDLLIPNCPALEKLSLVHNRFKYPFQFEGLKALPNLRVLDLNHNAVCGRTDFDITLRLRFPRLHSRTMLWESSDSESDSGDWFLSDESDMSVDVPFDDDDDDYVPDENGF